MATRAEESVAHVRRPLEGIYGVSLLTAILALVPYILVTSAYALFRKQVAGDIGAGPTGLEIINGLSTAGYAFGALLGGDLINRFKQRHLFLACEGFFILAAFSLPSRIVGRTFALVELVRSVADFILAPVMLGIARVVSGAMHPGAARAALLDLAHPGSGRGADAGRGRALPSGIAPGCLALTSSPGSSTTARRSVPRRSRKSCGRAERQPPRSASARIWSQSATTCSCSVASTPNETRTIQRSPSTAGVR